MISSCGRQRSPVQPHRNRKVWMLNNDDDDDDDDDDDANWCKDERMNDG